jgi:hypothetical protein
LLKTKKVASLYEKQRYEKEKERKDTVSLLEEVAWHFLIAPRGYYVILDEETKCAPIHVRSLTLPVNNTPIKIQEQVIVAQP